MVMIIIYSILILFFSLIYWSVQALKGKTGPQVHAENKRLREENQRLREKK
jgi:hypothetical protein